LYPKGFNLKEKTPLGRFGLPCACFWAFNARYPNPGAASWKPRKNRVAFRGGNRGGFLKIFSRKKVCGFSRFDRRKANFLGFRKTPEKFSRKKREKFLLFFW